MRLRNSRKRGTTYFLLPLLAIGVILSIPTVTLATPFEVIGMGYEDRAKVTIDGFIDRGRVYTEYELYTDMYGTLDAFCVEEVAAPSSFPELYEFLAVPGDLREAAWVAEQYWAGNTAGFDKEEYQIAIWELAFDGVGDIDLGDGNFIFHRGANRENIETILGWDFGDPSDMVALAHNPVGDYTNPGKQDYLVHRPSSVNHSIPEPATRLLLGFGLMALAGVGRRNLLRD